MLTLYPSCSTPEDSGLPVGSRRWKHLQMGWSVPPTHIVRVQGALRVNRYNFQEAYVDNERLDAEVLISGRTAMNRGMDGDVVAIEILPQVPPFLALFGWFSPLSDAWKSQQCRSGLQSSALAAIVTPSPAHSLLVSGCLRELARLRNVSAWHACLGTSISAHRLKPSMLPQHQGYQPTSQAGGLVVETLCGGPVQVLAAHEQGRLSSNIFRISRHVVG